MILGAGMMVLLVSPVLAREETNSEALPDFKEVSDLIRAHLAGETEARLNNDAVRGLLTQLHGRVSLVPAQGAAEEPRQAAIVSRHVVFEESIAYLRVGSVESGLAEKISADLKELGETNRLNGIVLDLRFADGNDYGEAAAAADLFIAKGKPLLDWGRGTIQSKEKTNAITLPLTVLINHETSGAAEALAAVLREDDRAIVIGGATAGEAAMTQDFPLKNGRLLRIAMAGVKLGDGETLSTQGVKPDIEVDIKPDTERVYLADPFKEIVRTTGVIPSILGEPTASGTNATNHAAHPRQINEAELMRERKEKPGVDVDELPLAAESRDAEPENLIVRDPVLGRALDLIKGIAALHKAHAP